MSSWRKCIIQKDAKIMDAVEAIDTSGMQIALILDEKEKLLGVLNDGDIRRAVLNRIDFSSNIETIMKKNPVVAHVGQTNEDLRKMMKVKQVHQIPLIDHDGKILNVISFTDVIGSGKRDNAVVMMAGGIGSRLMPLTENSPKPLLKIGSKPILEIILESFIEKGFYRFYISVNYMSEKIEDYFGNGSRWGVEIEYIEEKERLGSAGSLGLLKDSLDLPVIVMNGDILTKVDYSAMLSYHESEHAIATMAVREYKSRIPYGVINLSNNRIKSIVEKPMESYMVNAGIYILDSKVIRNIDGKQYLDMPDFFVRLINANMKTVVYPIREYWIDIGQIENFQQAQTDYDIVWGEV